MRSTVGGADSALPYAAPKCRYPALASAAQGLPVKGPWNNWEAVRRRAPFMPRKPLKEWARAVECGPDPAGETSAAIVCDG